MDPTLGSIVLVGWTFWDDDLSKGAEGRGTIRRDGVVAGIVAKVWPDKPSLYFPGQNEWGVDVTVFPPRADVATTYAPHDYDAQTTGMPKPGMWCFRPLS